MSGPLAGIRVIELATWHNGAAAGYMLGDLGAEVIKIEQPGVGDPTRGLTQAFGHDLRLPGGRALWFEINNRSKKSITLDLKKSKGREALYRLVEKSDVLFSNYDPDMLRRLGADYETLSEYNPRLIWAVSCGLGTKGPLAGKRTFDSAIQARTGFMFRMGNANGGAPILAGGGVFDQIGANMLVQGILAALVARERQGIGQAVEASMLGSAIQVQQDNVHMYLWKNDAEFGTSPNASQDPFVNWYRCADDKWIMLTEPHPDREWADFCRALELGEVERDSRFTSIKARLQNSKALVAILEKAFARKTRGQWLQRFIDEKVEFVYTPVNTVADLAAEPQVYANDYIVEMEHPTMGRTRTVGIPVQFSKTRCVIGQPPPEMGQHTEEVLQEIAGYDWDEIIGMREQDVV